MAAALDAGEAVVELLVLIVPELQPLGIGSHLVGRDQWVLDRDYAIRGARLGRATMARMDAGSCIESASRKCAKALALQKKIEKSHAVA